MKRISQYAVALGFVAATGVAAQSFAGAPALPDLNKKVTALLAPINAQPNTKMSIAITGLKMDEKAVTELAGKFGYSKVGSVNTLKLNGKAGYKNDGKNPTTTVKAALNFDFVKLMGQKAVNEMGPSVDEMVKDFVENGPGAEYGAAATVDAKVVEKKVDPKTGNLLSVKAKFNLSVDLSKLPADKPASEVPMKSLEATLVIASNGASVDAKLVSNPAYSGFEETGFGLKEVVEAIVSENKEKQAEFQEILGFVDKGGEYLVNTKAPESEPQP